MKNLLALGFFMLLLHCGYAQKEQDAEYLKTKKLPKLELLKPDSTWFTHHEIPENKPVVIVYFSPECGHCQEEAKDIAANIDALKNVFFIWITFHTPQEAGKFAADYGLANHPNMIFGRDPNYKTPMFYKITMTPYVAVYNKKGVFVKEYRKGINMKDFSKLIANMNIE